MTETRMDNAPAAVLWDMDGTLIDSEPLWLDVEVTMLGRYGIELTDEVRDNLIGAGLRSSAQVFKDLGVPLEIDAIIAEWTDGVIAGLNTTTPDWRPGALELLADLRAQGIPSALVTMSVRKIADAVIALLPAGSFVTVVAGDEVTHEKPHPEAYLRGAAAVGVSIADCLALEDSMPGVTAGHASGAIAIGIPNLLPLDTSPAHEVWASLADHSAHTLAARFTALRTIHPYNAGDTAGTGETA
ncbi:HAD superfamily hydrolase (TIGR01509 family) [Leucobacter exalbidus]|uniref:HAD superfamily hydrolase (TIGR01509 family) n=1 Tax=Leucobacter exalbidus TaxID=662960 RepID=A0A940T317_9MICO|nr:HAD family phosphatase [Leucobacter exalbidus]MBP1325368.1 HAD superfamily hydrolase (TIGR01509 family) [Leucobacter exalbidus]